jgi:hypothetical protein
MNYSKENDLLVVVILGLVGLSLLWIIIPVQVSIFNYLPLFLVSYLISIFLPGYTFLSFIQPDLGFNTRVGVGVPLSLVFLFGVSFLFIFLEIPYAFTYAVSVLMILSIILGLLTYLAGKMEGETRTPPTKRRPSYRVHDEAPKKTAESIPGGENKIEEEEIKAPIKKRRQLTPHQDAELIIPNHQKEEEGKTEKKGVQDPEKPTLKLPWIERQKEMDRQKK